MVYQGQSVAEFTGVTVVGGKLEQEISGIRW
jgi:hypothetical protein